MKENVRYRFKVLASLFSYAYGIKKYWGILLFSSFISMGLEFLNPVIYQMFINEVIIEANYSKMKIVIGGYISIFLVEIIVNYIKLFSKYKFLNILIFRIRKKILDNYFSISFDSYEKNNIGDMKMRIDDDTEYIKEFAGAQTIDYFIAIISIAFCTTFLLKINWIMAIFSVIVIPFTFWIDNILSKYEKIVLNESRENNERMTSWLHVMINGWREIKALNLSKHEMRCYVRFLHKEMLCFSRWINYWTARVLIVPKIKNVFFMQFGLYLVGGLLIIYGKLNIGELLVFAIYFSMLSNAIQTISTADADLQAKRPYINRFMDSLCVVRDESKRVKVLDDLKDIVLKNVSFKYPNAERYVIDNISLEIKSGERIAIVGKSGSGKTTLIKLLTGMLLPTSGEIIFGGMEFSEIKLDSMYKKIGFVMQENVLFHTTIKENLYFGKEDATQEDMILACKKACILEFIETLPEGFDTVIGENGIKLSGGQKQRIVLARMFLQNKDIYIFDEATSALDQYSENIIHDAIRSISRDKIIIIVSHRESSIKLCDRVVLIN